MRVLGTLTLLIAMAGSVGGCGPAEDASAAPAEARKEEPLSPEHAQALLAFYNELVDHAVKHAADCPALADTIDGVVNRHNNTLQMMGIEKNRKRTVPPELQVKLDERAREMVDALRRCWNDDGVKKAFKRMKPSPQMKKLK